MSANIILLTLIAGLAVNIFYSVIDARFKAVSADNTVKQSLPAKKAPSGPDYLPLARYQPIINRDLFAVGKTEKLPEPEPEPTKDLEVTDLNIKLWGTVTGKGPVKYAVIEARSDGRRRAQDLYREGDTVESATIEKIFDNKIVLNSNGSRQLLFLEKFESKGRRHSFRRSHRRPTRRHPRVIRRSISRKMVQNATRNFDKLISQAKVRPHKDGMRISSIKPRSVFRRLGLRNGDVIQSVNNRQISSMDDAMKIYQNLQNGEKISIQLLRRNRPRTIEYKIR